MGEPTKVKYDNLNFNLNYSYQDNDKQLLNIALRNQYSDTPSSMSDRISTLYEGDTSYSISDLSTSKVVIPSLDIYYQRNLKNKQTIYADIVASYLDSRMNGLLFRKPLIMPITIRISIQKPKVRSTPSLEKVSTKNNSVRVSLPEASSIHRPICKIDIRVI